MQKKKPGETTTKESKYERKMNMIPWPLGIK